LRFFRFACNCLKYSDPRLAISLPPFRPRVTAAGSFFLAKIQKNRFNVPEHYARPGTPSQTGPASRSLLPQAFLSTNCGYSAIGSSRTSMRRSTNSFAWYDRKKYAAMLREAFELFVLCLPKAAETVLLNDCLYEEEVKRFPLFAALALLRP
jgi:hypothetical protein